MVLTSASKEALVSTIFIKIDINALKSQKKCAVWAIFYNLRKNQMLTSISVMINE